jgi:hypothetical protein
MRPTSCRIIGEVQAAGHTSLTAIAGQLNARKVATANGGRWKHLQVKRILTGNIRRVDANVSSDGVSLLVRISVSLGARQICTRYQLLA